MTHTPSLWDRSSTINGVPVEVILEGLPEQIRDGDAPVVLLTDDDTGAVVVLQAWNPDSGEGGFPAFADDDAALAWGAAAAELRDNPPEPVPVEPTPQPPAPPTAEDFAQMRADLDWVINFAVTGEA